MPLNPTVMWMRIIIVISLSLSFSGGASAQEGFSKNHLQGHSDSYLTRAANQPVDWHPLNRDTLSLARKLHRPILLDVGAIWCAWCDRMDRESYNDPRIASFINAHFIAAKLDFDNAGFLGTQLQRAQAVLNLPAGLPLTSFITSGGDLFFGAGYLPPSPSAAKSSMTQALQEALVRFANLQNHTTEEFHLELGDLK